MTTTAVDLPANGSWQFLNAGPLQLQARLGFIEYATSPNSSTPPAVASGFNPSSDIRDVASDEPIWARSITTLGATVIWAPIILAAGSVISDAGLILSLDMSTGLMFPAWI